MVWNEGSFQDQAAKDTRRVLVAPSAVLVENGVNGVWHTFVKKEQRLPCSVTREIKTAPDQSTVPLRLFVGNSTDPNDRHLLDNIGFMGITGFVVAAHTTIDLTISVDEQGKMVMTAIDSDTHSPLSIGTKHEKQVIRRIFAPTFKTGR
eukprot:NODE_6230_length_558_cov_279.756381_g6065_i0.p2 GENE.NODE_6230_length_558_cov_279.756381_g6065_i0~~NODE_6230_length_558_cov_279.756381_g6065_i0.p2  ORF type:complete len:149 (+),score=24.29 NODE_6230_length_558_cov_279.756381_g6065_i0:69-515(+)